MGIAYQCDEASGCTFIVWDAEVTPEEWLACERRLFADPAFPPGSRALADLRSAGGAPSISVEVVREMAEHLREHAPQIGSLRFALVPNSAWGWTKATEFEKQLEGSGISSVTFTSLSTACTWLGIDATTTTEALNDLRNGLRA